ncbi:MAG: hypothetical protein ACRD3W_23425, partial [Terriglobales bacterium]
MTVMLLPLPGMFLTKREIDAFATRFGPRCGATAVLKANDNDLVVSQIPDAPVYRTTCGDTWFDIDAANGAILQRLDPSRRAYRWLYRALHTMDFPILAVRPKLRTAIILVLCGCGLSWC